MLLPFKVGISKQFGIRGLIATEDIVRGVVLERCPLIFIPITDFHKIKDSIINKYYFDWSKNYKVLVLGYGSLYNHSYSPNVTYHFDVKFKRISFKTLRDISKDQELTINYNYIPESDEPLSPELLDYNKDIVTSTLKY